MDDTNERERAGPPKEGSNRGNEPEGQHRANISETISTGANDDDGLGDERDNKLTPAEEVVPSDDELGVRDIALEDDETELVRRPGQPT